MRTNQFTPCFAALIALIPAGAGAENLAAARACGAEQNATARLQCYDSAFQMAPPPPAAQFGDNDHLQQQRAPKVDVPKTLSGSITKTVSLGQGLYRLTLDNGQVWQTQQADWALDFKNNAVIIITRMPMGGYQVSMNGTGASVSAKRMQ